MAAGVDSPVVVEEEVALAASVVAVLEVEELAVAGSL
jgi:hypothetical protein